MQGSLFLLLGYPRGKGFWGDGAGGTWNCAPRRKHDQGQEPVRGRIPLLPSPRVCPWERRAGCHPQMQAAGVHPHLPAHG